MKGSRFLSGMAIALACTTSYAADSDSDLRSQLEALKAQVAQQQSAMTAQQSEISQLRAANGDSWLTEARANEVKALVRDVLSDADTRASLADGGVAAGYKGGHFFIGSDDGNFLLTIWGLEQFRYIYNYRNSTSAGTSVKKNNSGFDNARTEVGFAGHLFDPKFTYAVDILISDNEDTGLLNSSGYAVLQNAWFGYEFADGWQVKGGQFRGPFLRETLVGDGHQLAVDRSVVESFFGIGYNQGVQVSYTSDMWRAMVMIHDGANSADANNGNWTGDSTDIAVAARAELLLAGKWAQFADFATWSGDSTGVLIGAAIDYENPTNTFVGIGPNTSGTQIRWTVDASVELPQLYGLSLFAAVVGDHVRASETAANGQRNTDQWGIVAQASIFVIPDKLDVFARWDHIDDNGNSLNSSTPITGSDNSVNFITAGTNYYFKGHSIKATLDTVFALDRVGFTNDQLGLLSSNKSGEFTVRAQFQFMF